MSPRRLIEYDGLDLDPSGKYRVLVNSRGDSDLPDTLRVCMSSCVKRAIWQRPERLSRCDLLLGGTLKLESRTKAPGVIWDVTISTPFTVFDFDTAHKRRIWSGRSGALARLAPAELRPQGPFSAIRVDWAGIVSDRRGSEAAEFSLVSYLVPMPRGSARVRFEARRLRDSDCCGKGVFRFDSVSRTDTKFDLAASGWSTVCSSFRNVSDAGSQLLLGRWHGPVSVTRSTDLDNLATSDASRSARGRGRRD